MRLKLPFDEKITVRIDRTLRTSVLDMAEELGISPSELCREIIDREFGHSPRIIKQLHKESAKMNEELQNAVKVLGQMLALYNQSRQGYIELKSRTKAAETVLKSRN